MDEPRLFPSALWPENTKTRDDNDNKIPNDPFSLLCGLLQNSTLLYYALFSFLLLLSRGLLARAEKNTSSRPRSAERTGILLDIMGSGLPDVGVFCFFKSVAECVRSCTPEWNDMFLSDHQVYW
jgi:hypothetical protein